MRSDPADRENLGGRNSCGHWRQSAPICTKNTYCSEVPKTQVLVVQQVFRAKRTNLHEKYDYP